MTAQKLVVLGDVAQEGDWGPIVATAALQGITLEIQIVTPAQVANYMAAIEQYEQANGKLPRLDTFTKRYKDSPEHIGATQAHKELLESALELSLSDMYGLLYPDWHNSLPECQCLVINGDCVYRLLYKAFGQYRSFGVDAAQFVLFHYKPSSAQQKLLGFFPDGSQRMLVSC